MLGKLLILLLGEIVNFTDWGNCCWGKWQLGKFSIGEVAIGELVIGEFVLGKLLLGKQPNTFFSKFNILLKQPAYSGTHSCRNVIQ